MSPSQQNGWMFRVQHSLCVTDKANRYLLKKKKKKLKKKKKIKKIKKRNLNLYNP